MSFLYHVIFVQECNYTRYEYMSFQLNMLLGVLQFSVTR